MKFIVTRHTSTDWNIAGRIQGQTDMELNEQGYREVEALTEELLGLSISRIVSSDLKRASQTAKVINSKLNVPLHLEKDLRECSFGKLEGMTKEETIVKYKNKVIKDLEDQFKAYDFRPFNGEYRDSVLKRHIKVLQKYSKFNLKDTAILLVGHGRGLITLLASLGYAPALKRGEYKIIKY